MKQFITPTKPFCSADANVPKPLTGNNLVKEMPNWRQAIKQGDEQCSIWTR
jgi:hypothetical protein